MTKIRDFAKVDLPREKLEKYGTNRLTDAELLAILLGSGIKGLNVLQLAKRILKLIEKIGTEKITLETLLKEKGVGETKASQIIAVLALSKRLQDKTKSEILSPKDVWNLCSDLRDSKKEHLIAFYFDTQNTLIERQIVSVGTLTASLIHPREVFEPAVALHAAGIIVAHNHPSGNLEPSRDDVEATKKLIQAGTILGVPVLDHVIVDRRNYVSMKALSSLAKPLFDWS